MPHEREEVFAVDQTERKLEFGEQMHPTFVEGEVVDAHKLIKLAQSRLVRCGVACKTMLLFEVSFEVGTVEAACAEDLAARLAGVLLKDAFPLAFGNLLEVRACP